MGTPARFLPEKLVIAILTSRIDEKDEIIQELVHSFGPADFVSAPLTFTYTHYYDQEMGEGIQRLFVSFQRLVDPSILAGIKIATNALEDGRREEGMRKVNLDPGLLCLSRFSLATTKDGSHRIPLSQGIYAEVTLLYQGGSFRAVEWTYPDYRSPAYIAILNEIRALYKEQVKGAGPTE